MIALVFACRPPGSEASGSLSTGNQWTVGAGAAIASLVLIALVGVLLACCWHEVQDVCSVLRRKFRRKRLVCVRFRGKRVTIPQYWENAGRDLDRAQKRQDPDFFDDKYPVEARVLEALTRLMNSTRCWGGGTSGAQHSFRVVRALRIEDSVMWTNYQRKAAEIRFMNRRGCSWGSGGAPQTSAKLWDEEHEDFVDVDLDGSINEAYLWHATHPVAASNIVETGFRIGKEPSVGARFGHGAYFAEDSAKADDYAKAGAGVFQDCYAMLLCRVALGRQHETCKMKDPAASDDARARCCDSTLAQPDYSGAAREFIIWDQDQVYPEYALIYERCVDDGGDESEETEEGGSQYSQAAVNHGYPWYWHSHADNPSYGPDGAPHFRETHPSDHMRPTMQRIIAQTWQRSWTAARKGADGAPLAAHDPHGDMPEQLRVLKVLRLENSALWHRYRDGQDGIHLRRGSLPPSPLGMVKTTAVLPLRLRTQLTPGLTESYLWCPCSPTEITAIAEQGFAENTAASWTERCGRGFRLAECSSRADEGCRDEPEGYYHGYYAMLLCRASLGRAFVLPPSTSVHGGAEEALEFDSCVSFEGDYRDFVVHSRDLLYPEYAVFYERIYSDRRSRGLHDPRRPVPALAKPLRPILRGSSAADSWSSEDVDESGAESSGSDL